MNKKTAAAVGVGAVVLGYLAWRSRSAEAQPKPAPAPPLPPVQTWPQSTKPTGPTGSDDNLIALLQAECAQHMEDESPELLIDAADKIVAGLENLPESQEKEHLYECADLMYRRAQGLIDESNAAKAAPPQKDKTPESQNGLPWHDLDPFAE